MAITFPVPMADFALAMRITEVRFQLLEYVQTSGTGRGEILTSEIAPPKWQAQVMTAPGPTGAAQSMQAMAEAIGAAGTFYLHNPLAPFPMADPDGDRLGSANVKILDISTNNKALRLHNLPSNYVLSRGDMLAFFYGEEPRRRALHRIVETVTASDAGGTPFFEVRPHLKVGTAIGLEVRLARPFAKMMFAPGTFQPGSGRPRISDGMSFTAIEAF